MGKEFEIQGCVEVPMGLSEEEFYDRFIGFVEGNHWFFGGGINEIIDGFYINADGSKGKHMLEDDTQRGLNHNFSQSQPATTVEPHSSSVCLHDTLVTELFADHSIAALIFLINAGRELEFIYKDIKCFISKSGSSKTVSLWIHDQEQAHDSMEALLESAVVSGQRLMHIFHEVTLETLF